MMKVLAFNMKKYRMKRKLSQMKLAELLDTATSYIGEIEICAKVPSMGMVEKIAKALAVEPFRLFVDDMERTNADEPVADSYLECLTTLERQALVRRITESMAATLRRFFAPKAGGRRKAVNKLTNVYLNKIAEEILFPLPCNPLYQFE
jgi:transcriptional regulator with XRE-family HTH domain